MVTWEIYYDDESIVTSNDMVWHDAPSRGVLFVLEIFSDGKKIIHMGMDYYFMRENSIISCSPLDLHNHLLLGILKGAIKFGRWCPDDVWQRVYDNVFGK